MQHNHLRRAVLLGPPMVLAGALAWLGLRPAATLDRRPIFEGVYFQADVLPQERGGRGPVYAAEIDLATPGVELFFAAGDQAAARWGYRYRLAWPGDLAGETDFALAVNGPLFHSRSLRISLPGDVANIENTLVDAGRAVQIEPNSFLLWLDGERRLHIELERGASPAVLARAQWAIGGYDLVLWQGQPTLRGDQIVDAQTVAGIDATGSRLWLAVFEKASGGRAARHLATLGATAAIRLDGGASSALYVGASARNVAPGYQRWPRRPSAVSIGVRARPLE